jgi:hypothetical protein
MSCSSKVADLWDVYIAFFPKHRVGDAFSLLLGILLAIIMD